MRLLSAVLAMVILCCMCPVVSAQQLTEKPDGLHSVALTTLGATAKGSGVPWNKSWPARNALLAGHGRPLGALFGAPMTGARMDIKLVIPVDIKGVELFGLDYHNTRQIAAVDILVDDKVVAKDVQLPERPGKGNFVALDAHGQQVSVVVTAEHPRRTDKNGKPGPTYGGWNRVRVYSSTDVAAMMADVEQYKVAENPAFIAPTGGSIASADIKVYGQPRVATEHPKTIWDKVDIEHYRKMLTTSETLQQQYNGLKKAMDQRISMEPTVPQPVKNDKGEYIHVSDRETGGIHNNLALDIANLGTVYVLSGEEKYAQYAKKLLLAYADAFPNYGVGARAGFSHDPSKVFDQRLSDATWLIQVARGYDLIYNTQMTEAERRHIEDDLIRASAKFIVANSAHLRGATNWSAIGTCSALIAGVATDDQDLIDTALWGINKGRSQGKWWLGESQKRPSGVELHFSRACIDDDGMWSEGAMGYQFMAMQAVLADAEILWHMGIDLYRYRNCALKRLFDSPLQYSYPDLRTPAIHDSGHASIIGREAYLYELGYRRYRDPKYLEILKRTGSHLAAAFQQFPVSVLYDVDLNMETDPVEWESVNLFGVGYGILRNTTERGTVSALIDYGPNRSHGHPDKLNLDLWAFGKRLLPDPGSIWYEQPLYRNWYRTSVAHNTLIVDELDQSDCGADQIVYAPAETFGVQRARTNGAYSGVMMDRSLFVTPEYTSDIFGAFARLPRLMELAWHPIGELESVSLDMKDFSFGEPLEQGYNSLDNVKAADTNESYKIVVDNPATPIRLVSAGGDETTVIIGDGYLGLQRTPTVLQRRRADSTIWANVIDYCPAGSDFVTDVKKFGSLDDGYAAMEITTAEGKDICFSNYNGESCEVLGLKTDAAQVFVRRSGGKIRSAYIAGGTTLSIDNLRMKIDTPALAYLERNDAGTYIVGNPSPVDITLSINTDLLGNMKVYGLDAHGKRTGELVSVSSAGAVELPLAASSRVEISSPTAPSMYEHRAAMLRRRMLQQQLAAKAAHEQALKLRQQREQDAKTFNVPSGTVVVVQAEDFSGEGGGSVRIATNKRGVIGKAFSSWNNIGHWLEWDVEVPADGYYNLALLYCSEQDKSQRMFEINGEPIAGFTAEFPSTGGWANSSDDWRLSVITNTVVEKPLLVKFKKGHNTLRIKNANGMGLNMDYLVVFSPEMQITRQMITDMLGGK